MKEVEGAWGSSPRARRMGESLSTEEQAWKVGGVTVTHRAGEQVGPYERPARENCG